MKRFLNLLSATLVCFFLSQTITLASSHREAPLISNDPLADNTDVYAFKSPTDANKIILIANYIPFEHPAGGPNWYTFGENIRYEIHVKNKTTTTGDDITYRFTFRQVLEDSTTFFRIRLGKENWKTFYTLQRSVNGGAFVAIVTNGVVPAPNIGPRAIENGTVGLGQRYETLMQNAITTATTGERVFAGPIDDPFFVDLGGAFDVGGFRKPGRDGLANFNCHSLVLEVPISTLHPEGKTVAQAVNILDSSFIIGVWASASRPAITTFDPTGSGNAQFSTNFVQVSRLGMPLTNEVIIPLGQKDKWNSVATNTPDEGQFAPFFKNPELALYMDDRPAPTAFGGAVPGLADLRIQTKSLGVFDFRNGQPGLFPVKGTPDAEGTAFGSTSPYRDILLPDNVSPRAADLLPIFLTGVPNLRPYQLATGKRDGKPLDAGKPFINNFLPTVGDMLRLNMAVPVTPRNSPDFSSLGLVKAAVLGLTDSRFTASGTALQFIPNMDGFPNGRRLEDDVTTIELQAVGGVVLSAIGLWYDDYTVGSGQSPVTPLLGRTLGFTAGPTKNDTTLRTSFPFVQTPWRGFLGAQYVGPTGSTVANSLYFRSKQSGIWQDPATWESSSDNINFTAAVYSPDFNSNTITVRDQHTVTINANLTLDQTVINTGGMVIVNPSIVLTVNDGPGADIFVSDLAGLLIRSTIDGSGSIGSSTGTIFGNIVTERFISNRRAWRLLGIPYSSSIFTFRDTWMEQLMGPIPGFGTQITTFGGDPNAANFDAQRPASSIRSYASDNFSSDAVHTPNTTSNLTSNPGYFLFVRGDRSIDRTTTGAPSSATTLRTFGMPNQGAVTKGIAGTNFSLIPNPYPSAINFDAIKAIAANSSINTFYVWDPSLAGPNGVGQYRTITISGSGPSFTYTATPGSTNSNWRFIESGTGFLVPGNRVVSFTEAIKTASIPPSSMLRTVSANPSEMVINLNVVNADNTVSLADGVREIFDNSYAAAIDYNDAKKMMGFNLNLGILSNNEVLAVEMRPMPKQDDIIALKLSDVAPGNYQFEIQSSKLALTSSAYLKDNYLNSVTPVDLQGTTKINFSITADASTASKDRFSIVFNSLAVAPGKPMIVINPNPVQNGLIRLQMRDMPKGLYNVKLVNNLGQTILRNQINHAGGTSVETIAAGKVNKGVYMFEMRKPDNTTEVIKIILN